MKITCSKDKLVKGVNIVSKAVPTRTTMAILECILIDASGSEIKMMANDMEIGIETIIEGTIEEKGILALDARFFSDIIRKCPESDIRIASDEKYHTVITSEKFSIELTGKPGEDFYNIPVIPRNEPLMLSQFTLRELIRQTTFTISETNTNNRMMTGELIEITGDTLKAVALEPVRISIRNIKLKESYPDQKVIVPGKTLNEIEKILTGNAEDMVEIFFTENYIIFEFDKTTVVSRLIDGEFFKIDHMFSTDYETKVKVNKRRLLEGIDRASLMIVKDAEKKPFIMDIQENSMRLKANNSQGKMYDETDIEKDGKDLVISFNPKLFMDALKVIDDEDVTLYMVNHRSPCFIRDDAGSYIYVILPVNLQD